MSSFNCSFCISWKEKEGGTVRLRLAQAMHFIDCFPFLRSWMRTGNQRFKNVSESSRICFTSSILPLKVSVLSECTIDLSEFFSKSQNILSISKRGGNHLLNRIPWVLSFHKWGFPHFSVFLNHILQQNWSTKSARVVMSSS